MNKLLFFSSKIIKERNYSTFVKLIQMYIMCRLPEHTRTHTQIYIYIYIQYYIIITCFQMNYTMWFLERLLKIQLNCLWFLAHLS